MLGSTKIRLRIWALPVVLSSHLHECTGIKITDYCLYILSFWEKNRPVCVCARVHACVRACASCIHLFDRQLVTFSNPLTVFGAILKSDLITSLFSRELVQQRTLLRSVWETGFSMSLSTLFCLWRRGSLSTLLQASTGLPGKVLSHSQAWERLVRSNILTVPHCLTAKALSLRSFLVLECTEEPCV